MSRLLVPEELLQQKNTSQQPQGDHIFYIFFSIFIQLWIELHILSLHWMMKNISYLISVKPEGLLRNIRIAHVFHRPMQAQNMNFNPLFTFYSINQIYLIIFHPTASVILIKRNISFVMEVLEQPGRETH